MSTLGTKHLTAAPTPVTRKRTRGGTIINTITAIIFFGLIVIETSNRTATIACQANFRAIGQNLQMYAISNGSFPDSQQELMDWSGNSRLFRCPDPNGGDYVYIPGLRQDMPASNVLLYEPNAVHSGRCNALFLGGQIELLTPEQLQQAIAATRAQIR